MKFHIAGKRVCAGPEQYRMTSGKGCILAYKSVMVEGMHLYSRKLFIDLDGYTKQQCWPTSTIREGHL